MLSHAMEWRIQAQTCIGGLYLGKFRVANLRLVKENVRCIVCFQPWRRNLLDMYLNTLK